MPLDPAADLAIKKKLEAPFVSRLRGWVAQLAMDLRTQLASSPTPNLVGMGEPILRDILRKHYSDVGAEFDHDLTDAMPVDVPVTANERESIAFDLARVFDEAADEQSALIMATAQERAVDAVRTAEALIVEHENLTLRDRPMLAANIFKTRQLGGVTSIACTETQWAAERSKGGEAFVIGGGLRNQTKFRGSKIKVWRNQGDNKVRGVLIGAKFNHFEPDGQEAEGDGFFLVSGERLRWPGDMTLGASIGNVANCRCSAIYDIKKVADLRRQFVVEIFEDLPGLIPLAPGTTPVLFPLVGETSPALVARDTEELWKDAAGNWLPKRRRLHKKIRDGIMKDAVPQKKPIFHMMGGGSGSGKSTVLQSGQVKLPPRAANINADDIKELLPEFNQMIKAKDIRAAGFTHEESSFLAKEVMGITSKSKMNTVLDGTGDGGWKSLKKKVDRFRDLGYEVHADYVNLPTDVAIKRALIRAKKSGRHIDVDVMKKIHKSVSQDFKRAVDEGAFDSVRLWDNDVPQGTKPILVFEQDGKGVKTVHNKRLWKKFLAKANE